MDAELENDDIVPQNINTDTLDDTVTELVESMSDPSPHAIETAEREHEDALTQYAQYVDSKNNPFDPAIHVTLADGSPSLTSTGKLRRRPGRKLGSSSIGTVASPGQSKQDLGQTAQAIVTGKSAANMLITVGMVIGGDEWAPVSDKQTGIDEQAMLEKSFTDYFVATGKTDIPPGFALVFAVGAYALPRFSKPKTKLRAKTFFGKISLWRKNRKLDKTAKKQVKTDEKQES